MENSESVIINIVLGVLLVLSEYLSFSNCTANGVLDFMIQFRNCMRPVQDLPAIIQVEEKVID